MSMRGIQPVLGYSFYVALDCKLCFLPLNFRMQGKGSAIKAKKNSLEHHTKSIMVMLKP